MRTTPLPLHLLLFALAACPAPRSPALAKLDLWACPLELSDAVLDDPQAYLACPLPGAVAELIRSDYADDELATPDWEQLRRFDGKVPREAFVRQLSEFIVPDQSLLPWIQFDPTTGLLEPEPVLAPDLVLHLPSEPLAAPPGHLQPPLGRDRPFRAERQAQLRASVDARHPVGALRVVLDPGHFGGPLAAFESREFTWAPPGGAPPITIKEGELTLKTALELKEKLEARGVEVFLTRDGPGPGHPYPLSSFRSFADGLLRHLARDPRFLAIDERLPLDERRRLRTAVALHAVRKQFIFEALRTRMRRAAELDPDLLVSIHFNASAGPPGRSYEQALVAMVKGSYEPVRLYNSYYRFRAIRDALELDEFNASAHLGARVLNHMSRELQLPIQRDSHRYPDHKAIFRADGSASGVDAWNGVLFRYVDFPAVLAEGPHMDERDEMPRLSAAMLAPLHQRGTRTERYAEGLAKGILEWAGQWLAQERNDFGSDLPLPSQGQHLPLAQSVDPRRRHAHLFPPEALALQ
ncbi:MAG TPA: N-acetylmuramoyl-L-alanine amidase [Myxococcales bacterium]